MSGARGRRQHERRHGSGHGGLVVVTAVLGALTMAPTVGDVGGCGREATDLDPGVYVQARKQQDCERCSACAITTARCQRACDPTQPPDVAIPPTCHPLLHDGEACLRALAAASCGTYASYVDDVAPSTPSECEFCRLSPAPTLGDGGAP